MSPQSEWQRRRVDLLKRMLVTAQARQVARGGASKSYVAWLFGKRTRVPSVTNRFQITGHWCQRLRGVQAVFAVRGAGEWVLQVSVFGKNFTTACRIKYLAVSFLGSQVRQCDRVASGLADFHSTERRKAFGNDYEAVEAFRRRTVAVRVFLGDFGCVW